MLIVIADDTALVTIPERETRSFAPYCSASTSAECGTGSSLSQVRRVLLARKLYGGRESAASLSTTLPSYCRARVLGCGGSAGVDVRASAQRATDREFLTDLVLDDS